MDESSGKGHSKGHSKCHSEGHSTMNMRERGMLEMLVFHLNLCPDIDSTLAGVAFKTGMEIPTVFPKWVQFWILAHHGTLCTCTAVLQVFHR